MGCCMAFNKKVLEKALPFPKGIPMHDIWIGLVAELYFKVVFINDRLVYHRRHNANASPTSFKSKSSFKQKLSHRYNLVKHLVKPR